MGAPKGRAGGNAGKGRPKGVPNKINRDIKEMVLIALSKAGGAEYLLEQSRTNPSAFLTLVGKVLPLQLTGSETAPISIRIVRYDGAEDNSYAEGRQATPPSVIEAEPWPVPASSLPPQEALSILPADAKDVDADTPTGTILPLSPRRERWRI
jgi:hypothetical protein